MDVASQACLNALMLARDLPHLLQYIVAWSEEQPPLPPPSLLEGFPDPQRVDARTECEKVVQRSERLLHAEFSEDKRSSNSEVAEVPCRL